MGGVMIHCYRILVEKFNKDNPNQSSADNTASYSDQTITL
jgi:hypothetical protein